MWQVLTWHLPVVVSVKTQKPKAEVDCAEHSMHTISTGAPTARYLVSRRVMLAPTFFDSSRFVYTGMLYFGYFSTWGLEVASVSAACLDK